MRSSTIRRLVAFGAVAVLAAACAGSDEGRAGDGTGAAAASGSGGGQQSGRYYGDRGGGMDAIGSTGATGDAGAGGAEVSVSLNNYLFDPARIEVETGTTIELANANANTPHTFTVKGTDIDVSLEPLSSDTTVVDLEPGTYDVFCRLHMAFDMTAELTVT
jgi:plastocyanin